MIDLCVYQTKSFKPTQYHIGPGYKNIKVAITKNNRYLRFKNNF